MPARALAGPVSRLGDRVLVLFEAFGEFGRLAFETFRRLGRRGFPVRATVEQFEAIAVRSTPIVAITALFTGLVLALQTVVSLTRFGAKPYTGSFVGLAVALELGPVLTALMVAGRVGAGITAEIGSMRVTEQVDAIRAMGADPVQKLVLPRVLAATLGLPLLTVMADLLGVFGGGLIAWQYGITPNFYVQSVVRTVTAPDFLQGIAKTFFFGWTIAMVGCYMGLGTRGGTVGVGRATTRSVVVGSIAIFISDFFLTKLMLML
ncbi:MAG: ABC transporter permease [Proteobacteria bacterium]|nr:ABC transporter permease [Pseudomonadota bacterium]